MIKLANRTYPVYELSLALSGAPEISVHSTNESLSRAINLHLSGSGLSQVFYQLFLSGQTEPKILHLVLNSFE